MSSSIGFDNSDFWLAAISITLIVALFLVILERRRFPKQQFIGRLFFSTLALVCLLLIYLKPYYSGYRQNQPTLIFTNGHQYKDSLLAEYPSAKSVYWNDSVKSDQLSSNLIIDGYGVPAYDQRKIGDRQVVFVAPKIPDGIIALNYAQRSKVSEPVIFNFEVNGLARHWLKLKTQSKTADSMWVEGDQRHTIKLTYMPASPGRFVNRIEVVNNEGTLIVSEPLPLEVFPVEKLNILLLNKQPTFEVRFLKNYLIEKGHAVYSRSELTKGRYAFESVGFDFERLDFLTERKLEQFHLVISTPEAVRALSGNERTHLERYIREQGLSLILRMDEPSESTKPNWYSFKGKQQDTERDFLDLKIGTQKITLESPRFYFDINGLIEPVFEGKRQPVAVVKPYGVGSVIGVAVDGTFKLALKGQKRLYDLFWTKIISAMSKETSDKLRIATHFPLENVPVDVNLIGLGTDVVLKYKNTFLPLIQREFVQQRWSSVLWPLESGWQQINHGDESYYFYVFDSSDWELARAFETMQVNREFMNAETFASTNKLVKTSVSLWWFYLIFLGSVGYLWLQPKLQ